MDIKEEVYYKAIDTIKKCSTSHGLYASAPPHGYKGVWSRDSMISLLGASLIKKPNFKNIYKKTLNTLAKYQSKLGQIPNCVNIFGPGPKEITFATIDSSLWFIIGEYIYARNYKDKSLLKQHKKNIEKAFIWIKSQDTGEDKLPEQQPTSDWQDAFPHKYGHTINTQALYFAILNLLKKKREAGQVKKAVNSIVLRHLCLYNKKTCYFVPWAWKDHDGIREDEHWFDSLGNLLTIIFNLATKEQANKILNYIKENKINKPYPVKAIFPPIKPKDKEWKPYFSKSDAKTPYNYLNAGIWTFIGGFYVTSLVKLKRFKEAQKELTSLAKANNKDNFSEWLHGKTGKAYGGKYHAWNAGMYILAYKSVKQKKCLI